MSGTKDVIEGAQEVSVDDTGAMGSAAEGAKGAAVSDVADGGLPAGEQVETTQPEQPLQGENPAGEQEADLVALMNMRAQTYGMLSRLFRVEVDADTLRELQSMRFPAATGNAMVDEGYHQLYDYLRQAWDDSVTELAIDYVRTFIGHGVNGYSAAYPFESVYTSERRLLMQEARAEVLAEFRAQKLKRGAWTEGEDHIALELEFMQRMSLRCAEALEAGEDETAVEHVNTMYDFLENHLINWVPMLVADMRRYAHTLFYQGLAQLTHGFVLQDEEILRELRESAEE